MRALLAAATALAILAAGLTQAVADPVEPAQRDAVLAIYQAWNKAIAAGKLNDAMALRSADRRARVAPDIKTAAQQKRVLDLLKSTLPETVEVLHATQSKDGSKISLITVIGATIPAGPKRAGMPDPGTRLQAELTLDFLREKGVWKFDNQTRGMDPSKVKPCVSSGFPGMAAFEERRNLTMGGQIRRVNFGPDHTLVVIRMFDEENCIYLPAKARLAELGFNAELLAPWAIIEINAWPHRTDKQSVWADSLGIAEAD